MRRYSASGRVTLAFSRRERCVFYYYYTRPGYIASLLSPSLSLSLSLSLFVREILTLWRRERENAPRALLNGRQARVACALSRRLFNRYKYNVRIYNNGSVCIRRYGTRCVFGVTKIIIHSERNEVRNSWGREKKDCVVNDEFYAQWTRCYVAWVIFYLFDCLVYYVNK